jgi:MATE family multidrug resistance protein
VPRTPSSAREVGYGDILKRAWPIMVANAAAPLLGLADTAVIGHTGRPRDLGALALGTLVFNFATWTFGFLRMATTGFVAQADGAGDREEVRHAFSRAVVLGAVIGVLLVLLQVPLCAVALWSLDAHGALAHVATDYIRARVWGAPAALVSFAVTGTLVGLGKSRQLLFLQLFLNCLNVTLDLAFAGLLHLGARGIGLGTAISEWAAALVGVWLIVRQVGTPALGRTGFGAAALLRTFSVQFDILLRTLFLLFGFAWFARQGTRLGNTTLAANHVLLQFVSLSAFFLDGFAFVTESLTGAAAGARSRPRFDRAVRLTNQLSLGTALVLALAIFGLGGPALSALTEQAAVATQARSYLPYTALYVAVAWLAFQLDGVFIGLSRARDMRNASLASLAAFLLLGWPLTERFGNDGLWLAFIGFVLARGLSLGALFPRARRALS